ncbi:MAG: CoA transferase [Chloroflexi bacterium]|nr:CoA transferase [Chloroflexota bacterium]
MATATGPLAGINVLEFTQIIAGPFGCMLLSDMGANVTKFEPLEGEPWRIYNQLVPGESRGYISLNRGKRGVAMDLRRPEAREIIHRLVPRADVVVINYRPGVAEDLGIDYPTLAAINPRLIYCENTAYGRRGPLARAGGYDIVVQSFTGLMAGEGKMQGDVPTYIYPAVADFATGMQMANSICAALYVRERTGRGQRIDTTLMGTAIAMQAMHFTWIDAFDDHTFGPMLEELKSARAGLKSFAEQQDVVRKYRPAPAGNIYYRVYQTADGFITIGALSPALRTKVLAATGMHDPRQLPDGTWDLQLPGFGPEAHAALVAEAEALFRTRTSDEWMELFIANGVPAGPLNFIEELFDHPQSLANGLITETDHPLVGHMRTVGPAFQMSETPLAPRGPSPVLGADTDAVLSEAGCSPDDIAALRRMGVIL